LAGLVSIVLAMRVPILITEIRGNGSVVTTVTVSRAEPRPHRIYVLFPTLSLSVLF
jgi:hypothetical protein